MQNRNGRRADAAPASGKIDPGIEIQKWRGNFYNIKYCLFNHYILNKPIDCFISILYDDLYQLQERNRAAKELFHIVSSDLREVPAEELSSVLEYLTKQMLDNVKVSKCNKE